MTLSTYQIDAYTQYNLRKLSKEDLRYAFFGDAVNNESTYMLDVLQEIICRRNEDELDRALCICFTFDLFTKVFEELLIDLVRMDWHHSHEDIVSVLDDIQSEKAIDALYETALSSYEYLNFDKAYALAVKCIWALYNIGTGDAIEKLKQLALSENAIIKENAEEMIKKIEQDLR